MKFKRTKLLFCSLFIGLSALSSSLNIKSNNEHISSDETSIKEEIFSDEKEENDLIKEKFLSNLSSNSIYDFDSASYIALIDPKTYQKINLDINYGNITFLDSSSVSYNISFSYVDKNNKKSDLLLNNTSSTLSTIKNKEELYYLNQKDELKTLFNYQTLTNKDNSTLKSISFKDNNLSISDLFNEIFSTIKNSTIYKNDFLNEYIFKNDIYNINIDQSTYNLKSISTNSLSKSLNFEIDFKFINKNKQKATSSSLINKENPADLITTLTKLLNNSNFKTVFDFKIDPIKEDNSSSSIKTKSNSLLDKSYHFKGDINVDYKNHDLLDNGKVELNLIHYTNKDLSNDLSLRYQDTSIYFRSGSLIKGKIKEETVSSLVDVVSLITNDTSFTRLVNNPLNNLINNDTFLKITNADLSSFNLDNLDEYIKELNIRNNLITLKVDSALFNLPSFIFTLKVGLQNLKLKTIEINDFKINDEALLNGNMRFIENSSFINLNEKDYPSYDFAPSLITSLYKLVDEKRLGGRLSLSVKNKIKENTFNFVSNIDADLSSLDLNDPTSIKNLNLALINPSFSNIVNGNYTFELPIKINKINIQKDSQNKNAFFIDGAIGKNDFLPLKLKFNDSLFNSENDSSSTIKNILEKLGVDTGKLMDSFDLSSIINKISSYIDEVLINPSLKSDLKKVINDYSFSHLENIISIFNDGNFLEIRINVDYLFNEDLSIKGENDEIYKDQISLFYNINRNKFQGLYLNINDSINNIELLYNYDYYNYLEFIDKNEENNYLDLNDILSSLNPFINNPPSFTLNNIYDVDVKNIDPSIDINNVKVGIKKDEETNDIYSEGMFNINIDNNTNLDFKFIYDDKEFNDEYFTLGYSDGKIIYNEANEGIKIPEGQLQAEIRLNNMKTPLHTITKTSSPFNVLSEFLNISDENVLAPFRDSFSSILDQLFTQNIPLFNIISNGEYLKLLDKEIFPSYNLDIKENSDNNKIVDLSIEINPKYINDENSELSNKENVKIEARINLNQANSVIIDSLLIDATNSSIFNIENFYLKLTNSGEFVKNSENEFYLLDTFTKYSESNKSDFVNIDDCVTLAKLGLSTTEQHYFELEGILDLSASFLSLNVDLSGAIPQKYVNAKIELIKPEGEKLYSQTRAHLTLRNYGSSTIIDSDDNFVEYFTERLDLGANGYQEICYIVKTKGYYHEESQNLVKGPELVETVYTTSSEVVNNLFTKYPSDQYQITGQNILPSETETYFNKNEAENRATELKNQYNDNNVARVESEGFIIKRYKVYISQRYDVTITTKAIYETIPAHNEFEQTIYKVTQDEMLGNGGLNLIYYLLDLSIIEELDLSLAKASHEDIMAIIYYNVFNSETSGNEGNSELDLFACLNQFEVNNTNFSMNVDLGKLINYDDILGLKIDLTYNENKLTNLNIYGNGEENTILNGLGGLISASVSLNIKLVDNPVGMDRYDNFINAIHLYEQTNNLDYFVIENYENKEATILILGFIPTSLDGQTPVTNNAQLTLKLYSYNDDEITKGLIYGLN